MLINPSRQTLLSVLLGEKFVAMYNLSSEESDFTCVVTYCSPKGRDSVVLKVSRPFLEPFPKSVVQFAPLSAKDMGAVA